jgi:hypothetical protein
MNARDGRSARTAASAATVRPRRRRAGDHEDDQARAGGEHLVEAQLPDEPHAEGDVAAEVERHAPAQGQPRAVAERLRGMSHRCLETDGGDDDAR